MADEDVSKVDPNLPPCAWCGEPSVTEVITRPGTKHRVKAPVCAQHAKQFERQGAMTVRMEDDKRTERERQRAEYLRRSGIR